MVKQRSEEAIAKRQAEISERKKTKEEIGKALRTSVDRETGKPVVGKNINKNLSKETRATIRSTAGPTVKQQIQARKEARARGEKVPKFQSSQSKAKSAAAVEKRIKKASSRAAGSLKAFSSKAPKTLGNRRATGASFKASKPTGVRKATVVKGASPGRPTKKAAPAKPKRSSKKKK